MVIIRSPFYQLDKLKCVITRAAPINYFSLINLTIIFFDWLINLMINLIISQVKRHCAVCDILSNVHTQAYTVSLSPSPFFLSLPFVILVNFFLTGITKTNAIGSIPRHIQYNIRHIQSLLFVNELPHP